MHFLSLQILFYLHVFYMSTCSINNANVEQKLAQDRGLQVDIDLLFSTLQEKLFIQLQILPKTPPSTINVSFMITRPSSRDTVKYLVEIQMHSIYYIPLLY